LFPLPKYGQGVQRSQHLLQICIVFGAFWGGNRVAAQTPVINGVVNQATFNQSSGVAPGSVAMVVGTNLATTTASASSLPLPSTLAGTSVTVNGISAPLFYVSPTQINFQMPWELTASSNPLIVNLGGTLSAPYAVSTPQFAPGVVTANGSGTGAGQILHSDYSLVTSSSPAVPGETVIVLCMGFGPVTPAVADGAAASVSPASLLTSSVSVLISGIPASVAFAGLAPGSVGYEWVDIVIPSFFATVSPPANLYTLQLYVGGLSANAAGISIGTAGSTAPNPSSGGTVNGASFAPVSASNGPIAPGAIVPFSVRTWRHRWPAICPRRFLLR
jgi:uncharacterized protein (TIGR03437 family)